MNRFLSASLSVLLSVSLAHTAEFFEDFESYRSDQPLEGQGEWSASPHGKHPAALVVSGNGETQPKAYVRSPGSGDHHNIRKLPPELASSLSNADIVWLSAVHRGGCGISVGPLRVFFGDRTTFRLGQDRSGSGLTEKTETGQWIESIFVLEKQADGSFLVRSGNRPWPSTPETPFVADPMIGSAPPLPTDELALSTWKAATLRLDNNQALDDLRIGHCSSAEELPFKLDTSRKLETAFAPILDHLLPPRQATDLGGLWESVASTPEQKTPPASGWAASLVPDKHTELFSKEKSAVWFRRSFPLPEKEAGKRYELCFERVTDRCEIFVNGSLAASSDDGFFPFRIDVTDHIHQGDNDLVVKVYGPTPETVPGKRPQGLDWLYGSYRGIPYPVHLESRAAVSVKDIFVITRLTPASTLELLVEVGNETGQPKEITVKAGTEAGEIALESDPISLQPGESRTVVLKKEWNNPRLWQLHDPHLYNLDVQISDGGRPVDARRQRFGFREVRVEGPDILLNGAKTIHRRSSTIVYWNTEESRRVDIPRLRERGFNGYRLHLGSSLRVTRICDELGWLVSPEGAICVPHGDGVKPEFWPAADAHLAGMVRTLRNSPSVIYWSLSNEFAAYYMKGTDAERAVVDGKMVEAGQKVTKLDPTRIWTCSGDGELGGKGNHGPAPALSFHYAWQPSKLGNRIPATSNWLQEGLSPWQGIVWDKSKPIMLSEDLYPPYSLNIPDGMTQWAGDIAYDLEGGAYQAWFDAMRMLAAGYYRAGVSVWNPWGTAEREENNPLYAIGQPMPDFLIAPRQLSGGIKAGATARWDLELFNQTSREQAATLQATITTDQGEQVFAESRPVTLSPGKSVAESFSLPIPNATSRTLLQLRFSLTNDQGQMLAEEKQTLSACPELTLHAPPHCALVAENPEILKDATFPKGRFSTLQAALAERPGSLVIVQPKLDIENAKLLREAVSKGLKVLLIEPDTASVLPVRTDAKHIASFAFIRTPDDAALRGLVEADLRLWQPDLAVSRGSFLKPVNRNCDIILDCGGTNGLQYSPLLRLYSGRGYYLLCQLPVVSALDQEPRAALVLQNLLNSLNGESRPSGSPAAVLEDEKSPLAKALQQAGLPVAPPTAVDSAPLLLVDGRQPITEQTWNTISSRAGKGLSSMINGITPENAALLSQKLGGQIALKPSAAQQVVRSGSDPLTSGLSNGDLCWMGEGRFYRAITERMSRKSPPPASDETMLDGEIITELAGAERPFTPSGVVRIPYLNGHLVLSALRWDKFLTTQPVKARTVIGQLLRNQGCQIEQRDASVPTFEPLDIRTLSNRGFWARPEEKVPAWFGDPKEDFRYFPVNVTGYDPHLKMAQPPEKFPQGVSNYTGVDFQLIDPETNEGRSCLILPPEGSVSIPLNGRKAAALWMLGALDGIKPSGTEVTDVTFLYADGTKGSTTLRAGVELNGYQYMSPVSKGLCAWSGPTTLRKDAVVWCWDVANPFPDKKISTVTLTAKNASLALAAITSVRPGD